MVSSIHPSPVPLSLAAAATPKKRVSPSDAAARVDRLFQEYQKLQESNQSLSLIYRYGVGGLYNASAATTLAIFALAAPPTFPAVVLGGAALGTLAWLGNERLSQMREEGEEKLREASHRKIQEIMEAATESERAKLAQQTLNKEEPGWKHYESLIHLESFQNYIKRFSTTEEQAVATTALIQSYASWKGNQENSTSPSVETHDALVRATVNYQKGLERDAAQRLRTAQNLQKSVEVLTNQVRDLQGAMPSSDAARQLSLLEAYALNRMTADEKLDLIDHGLCKATKEEKAVLRQAAEREKRFNQAALTIQNMGLAVQALDSWGIDVSPNARKAVDASQTALSALSQVSYNPVGAFLTAAGGLGRLFGKQAVDIATVRDSRYMQMFDQLIAGQQLLMRGQSKIFEQGNQILLGVQNLQEGQEMTLKSISELSKLQLTIYQELEKKLDGVMRSVIQGVQLLFERSTQILNHQFATIEIAKDTHSRVYELQQALATASNELAFRSSLIYYSVLSARVHIAELHDQPITDWVRAVDFLTAESSDWNPILSQFSSPQIMLDWTAKHLDLMRRARDSYVTLLTSTTSGKFDRRLLWETREADHDLMKESASANFRIAGFLPLARYVSRFSKEEKLDLYTSLLNPQFRLAAVKRKETSRLRLTELPSLFFQEALFEQLLHPETLLKFCRGIPLLAQLLTLDKGRELLTLDALLANETVVSNSSRKLLDKVEEVILLAVAQQALTAGEYLIHRIFNKLHAPETSLQEKLEIVDLLYDSRPTMSVDLTRYETNPLTLFQSEREALIDALFAKTCNNLLLSNLSRYLIQQRLEICGKSLDEYTLAYQAAPLPHLLQKLFPDWKFLYSEKRGCWLGCIPIDTTSHILPFALPTPLEVRIAIMQHTSSLESLIQMAIAIHSVTGERQISENLELRGALLEVAEIST